MNETTDRINDMMPEDDPSDYEEISYCHRCFCMTKTINQTQCGKCKKEKFDE